MSNSVILADNFMRVRVIQLFWHGSSVNNILNTSFHLCGIRLEDHHRAVGSQVVPLKSSRKYVAQVGNRAFCVFSLLLYTAISQHGSGTEQNPKRAE